ncbi:MAG: PEP-CTERM sorting domain-containing protein [Myxococcota bacterium]
MQLFVQKSARKSLGLVAVLVASCFFAASANAVPITVTYGVAPGSTLNLGGPNIPVAAGSYNVTYSNGSPAASGSIGDGTWSLTGLGLLLSGTLAGTNQFGIPGPIAGSITSGAGVTPFSTAVGLFQIVGNMSIGAVGGTSTLDVVNGSVVLIAPFNMSLIGVELNRTVVPEPSTALFMGLGLAGFAGVARRQAKKA